MENRLVLTDLNQDDVKIIASLYIKIIIDDADYFAYLYVNDYVNCVERLNKTFGKNKNSA